MTFAKQLLMGLKGSKLQEKNIDESTGSLGANSANLEQMWAL